uniref:Alpha-galactosidase n=1 Tax=Megaselia scalaris TaxID=36166 RepID=T1GC27_MEGSC
MKLLIFLCAVAYVSALDNGLARTPPMGFLSWERYRCITDCEARPDECISERSMVELGYKDAGYEYVIIDDCWLEPERDNQTGRLVPDRKRFPNGMKAVADYIHSRGLKFGLYEDYGTHTCGGYPGVIDHMQLDAQTFAEWEVDYVKLDGCYAEPDTMNTGYPLFGVYLNQTGRPMVYSCSWPVYQLEAGIPLNYNLMIKYCNLWRNWDDIQDSYDSLTSIMDFFSKNQDTIQPHAGPGHWNDPDMLLLGNFGLSYDQSKTQMAVWSILAAPLLMSTDVRAVSPEIKEILQNREIIAINQDLLGIQGRKVAVINDIEIWTRPVMPVSEIGQYSYAVALVSRRDDGDPYAFEIKLENMNLNNTRGYFVNDLFQKAKIQLIPHKYNSGDVLSVKIILLEFNSLSLQLCKWVL